MGGDEDDDPGLEFERDLAAEGDLADEGDLAPGDRFTDGDALLAGDFFKRDRRAVIFLAGVLPRGDGERERVSADDS